MVLRTIGRRCPYPAGWQILTDDANFNPNTVYLETTWDQIKGRVLVGVDESDDDFFEAGKTGGEKEHQLTIHEMPSHSHSYYSPIVQKVQATSSGNTYGNYNKEYKISTSSTGGDQFHNNMQPYRTTYIWVRTK